jgi:hypothetical protein
MNDKKVKKFCFVFLIVGMFIFILSSFVNLTNITSNSENSFLGKLLENLYIFGIGCIAVAFLLGVYLGAKRETHIKNQWRQVLKTGLVAEGILEDTVPLNTAHTSSQYMRLLFKVNAKTGETWQAQIDISMPKYKSYMLALGTKFPLRYDAKDRNALAIVDASFEPSNM